MTTRGNSGRARFAIAFAGACVVTTCAMMPNAAALQRAEAQPTPATAQPSSLPSAQPSVPPSPLPTPSTASGEASPTIAARTPAPVDRWSDRLRALDGRTAKAYFDLGEDVAASTTTVAESQLAKVLFVLAFDLTRAAGDNPTLAGSACLALASLPGLERERTWLLAMAGVVDRRFAARSDGQNAERIQDDEVSRSAAYDAATFLGHYRAGQFSQAQRLLESPEVRRVLERYERLLLPMGGGGALSRMERELAQSACPECRNERFVQRRGVTPPEFRICPACKGRPGPKVSDDVLIGQLRFESRLLRGIHTSWSAQLVADQRAPLRDPEPTQLAASLRVETRKVLWRDGTWVEDPNAPKENKVIGPAL
jgi:hypothetical protein